MPFRTETSRRAARSIRQLPQRDAARVLEILQELSENPYPRGSRKLQGTSAPLWRYRVGNYRIVYSVANEAQLIVVERIERRTNRTYENLP